MILTAILNNNSVLCYASSRLADDEEIVRAAVERDGLALQYASKRLKKQMDVVLAAIRSNGSAWQYIHKSLRGNRQLILEAMRNGCSLKVLPDEIRDNPIFVIEAIRNDCSAYQYASDTLRADPEIALLALSQSHSLFDCVPDSLNTDYEFIQKAVAINPKVFTRLDVNIRADRNLAVQAVSNNGLVLKHLDWYHRADREIVLVALAQNGMALKDTKMVACKSENEDIIVESKNSIVLDAVTIKEKEILQFGNYAGNPIQWIVLDVLDDKCLLISKDGLDVMPYSSGYDDVTWESSTIRKWLNNTFFKEAFNKDEQKSIMPTSVHTEGNIRFGAEGGKDTIDKVFLLSKKELQKYSSFIDLSCKATSYAQTGNADIDSDTGNCLWWLRTPGYDNFCAETVSGRGNILYDWNVNFPGVCIRPAIFIKSCK